MRQDTRISVMLHAFLFFHCNLAFSSIEEEDRGLVIDRCYEPMLDLAEKRGIPIGVEATAWTLEQAALLRPAWLARLRRLAEEGRCQCIGSGYAQLIGPLVPAAVGDANQRLGQAGYERLLGRRPALALINEQAWSPGILEQYSANGYSCVIMEWDNPREAHPEWPAELRYAHQAVRDTRGGRLGLLWNQSILFQHLQRLAHGDLCPEEYRDLLAAHDASWPRALCLYGNDAEIFGFRPGRFATEARMQQDEWDLLGRTLEALRADGLVSFHLPGAIFDLPLPHAGRELRLESASCPIPVKKQPKYNILRWALSGRGDGDINSRCHALFQRLSRQADAGDDRWKTLCLLWSSDFRTHITERRWQACLRLLEQCEREWPGARNAPEPLAPVRHEAVSGTGSPVRAACPTGVPDVETPGAFLHLRTEQTVLSLNPRKGLAVERLVFPEICPQPLAGTLPHGFFDSISQAADFFTGHVVMEIPGSRKYTDLEPVVPRFEENAAALTAECSVASFYCPLEKRLAVRKDCPGLDIAYRFSWPDIPVSSIRLLHLTLVPGVFDPGTLFYASHNGGRTLERHGIQAPMEHGSAVSFLVSARTAFAMTEGEVRLGDKDKELIITTDQTKSALMGMITHQVVLGLPYTRLTLSLRECDDTARAVATPVAQTVALSLRARKRERAEEV